LALFALSAVIIALVLGSMRILRLETAGVRRAYFRCIARVLGLTIIARGRPSTARPLMYVANHISYLDVVALGALVEAEFVARGDLAGWPIFGFLAKLGSTVFIDRARRSAGEARDQIDERLKRDRALIMFPESTSGDGNHLLPFKSALFNVVERDERHVPVTVQPVSIAYTRMNGLPIGVGWRPFFAWYGDMTLPPHLWKLLKLGSSTVEVMFHQPVTVAGFGGRKRLAAHCHRVCAEGFARMLAGRAGDS
jgi:1-acyl-sn-glycerol-3-phosphate acyltransferase